MADHYAGAVEAFVSKQNGDALTPHIVYEFVKALNADGVARHKETMEEISKLTSIVSGRAEAIDKAKKEVKEEILSLESWPALDDALEKAVAESLEKHEEFHCRYVEALEQAKRRSSDPVDADWVEQRLAIRDYNDPPDSEFLEHRESAHPDDYSFQTRFMWWWGGKIGYVALAALITSINMGLNYLWFGRP